MYLYFVVSMLTRFRRLDTGKLEHRKQFVDSFINTVPLVLQIWSSCVMMKNKKFTIIGYGVQQDEQTAI